MKLKALFFTLFWAVFATTGLSQVSYEITEAGGAVTIIKFDGGTTVDAIAMPKEVFEVRSTSDYSLITIYNSATNRVVYYGLDTGNVSIPAAASNSALFGLLSGYSAPAPGGTSLQQVEAMPGSTTNTPLAPSGTFTGTGTDVENYNTVLVTTFTDVNEAVLFVEWSIDNVNWSEQFRAKLFEFETREWKVPVVHKYYRVRVVNGGSAMSFLNVYTIATTKEEWPTTDLSGIREDDQVRISKNLDSKYDLVSGKIESWFSQFKFGYVFDVDPADPPLDVWNGAAIYTGQPLDYAPATVTVVSSSVDDDSLTGQGAHQIKIYGLESPQSTEYSSEIITLEGADPVASTKTWWRVNRAEIVKAGTLGANQGQITIQGTGTGTPIYAELPALENQTLIGAWTVPARCIGYLQLTMVEMARTGGQIGSAVVAVRVRAPGQTYQSKMKFTLTTSNSFSLYSGVPIVLPAGSDIVIRILSVSDTGSSIAVQFEAVAQKQ